MADSENTFGAPQLEDGYEDDAIEASLDQAAAETASQLMSLADEVSYDGQVLRFGVQCHRLVAAERSTRIGKSTKKMPERRVMAIKQNSLSIISIAKNATCLYSREHSVGNSSIPSEGIAFEITPELMKAVALIAERVKSVLWFEVNPDTNNLKLNTEVIDQQSNLPYGEKPRKIVFSGNYDANTVCFEDCWETELFESLDFVNIEPRRLRSAIKFAGALNSLLPGQKNSQCSITVDDTLVAGGYINGITIVENSQLHTKPFSIDYRDQESVCRILGHFGEKTATIKYFADKIAITSGWLSCVIRHASFRKDVLRFSKAATHAVTVNRPLLLDLASEMSALYSHSRESQPRLSITVRPLDENLEIELAPAFETRTDNMKAWTKIAGVASSQPEGTAPPSWEIGIDPHDLTKVLSELPGPSVSLGLYETAFCIEQEYESCRFRSILAAVPKKPKMQHYGGRKG
jgi:hypothetical protein